MPKGGWEAMAAELTVRGEPYRLDEKAFPPGEWVAISAADAERLRHLGWAELRQKGGD